MGHTIVLCRSIGGHRPIEPRATLSELLDLAYMRTDESEQAQALEQIVQQFSEVCEHNAQASRAWLALTFYATQERKSGLWSMLVGGQEKVPFEQWRIDVNVQPQRHFANPADNLREEARLQAQASQQVEQVLQFVIAHASKCVDHLPPPLQSQSVYRFQVSFSPLDVKGHSSGALLPQGLRSTFNIPYL